MKNKFKHPEKMNGEISIYCDAENNSTNPLAQVFFLTPMFAKLNNFEAESEKG